LRLLTLGAGSEAESPSRSSQGRDHEKRIFLHAHEHEHERNHSEDDKAKVEIKESQDKVGSLRGGNKLKSKSNDHFSTWTTGMYNHVKPLKTPVPVQLCISEQWEID